MTRTTTYLLAGGALAALLLLAGKSSSSSRGGGGTQPPAPSPNVDPNVAILRAQLANLLKQADLAPGTVDPTTMLLLADQLDAAGLHDEAGALRAKAGQILPPVPRPNM